MIAGFKGFEAFVCNERGERHEVINEIVGIEGISKDHGSAGFFVTRIGFVQCLQLTCPTGFEITRVASHPQIQYRPRFSSHCAASRKVRLASTSRMRLPRISHHRFGEAWAADRPPRRMIGTTAIRRLARRAMTRGAGTGPACAVPEGFGIDKHEGGDRTDPADSMSGGCNDP